jgi:hypothetical protein
MPDSLTSVYLGICGKQHQYFLRRYFIRKNHIKSTLKEMFVIALSPGSSNQSFS